MKCQWVLIDLSFLAYRVIHQLKDLEHRGTGTGVLYGFFEQLKAICTSPLVASNKVVIFVDSNFSVRRDFWPEYKKKRRENRTEEEKELIKSMYVQLDILTASTLPKIGIQVVSQKGLESDDLIAYASNLLQREEEMGIIISSDGDLYQCINPFVNFFDPQRNRHFDVETFQQEKGISPGLWGEVKAIGGCASDNVPGLKGISEKGAIDILLGNLPGNHRKVQLVQSKEGQLEIEKWRRLVSLPHEETTHFALHAPVYDKSAFYEICESFGLSSYLKPKQNRQWNRFFEGKISGGAPRMRKRNGQRIRLRTTGLQDIE